QGGDEGDPFVAGTRREHRPDPRQRQPHTWRRVLAVDDLLGGDAMAEGGALMAQYRVPVEVEAVSDAVGGKPPGVVGRHCVGGDDRRLKAWAGHDVELAVPHR